MDKKMVESIKENSGNLRQLTSLNNKLRKLQDRVLELEQFKKMWGELTYELEWHKPEEPLFVAKLEISGDEEYLNEILDMMANIRRKYFPKEKTKDESKTI